LPVTGRFKTTNNFAHNSGIAAHPCEHARPQSPTDLTASPQLAKILNPAGA
jgi:hypothetical protein